MKKNNLIEGTIIATGAIILVKILGMLYVIPFYQIVGSNGGALYSYAYNIYAIFLALSSAGLPNAVSKVISEYNTLNMLEAKNRAYHLAKNIIAFISIIAFLILFIFADEIGAFIINDLSGGNTISDVAFAIRCVSPAVLIIPFLSVTKGFLQGHKFVTPSSIGELIEQLVRIIVILCGSYLCLNILNKSLSFTIGVAVSGAFFGGIAAYIYLKRVISKHKKELDFNDDTKRDNIESKEIVKKIIKYAIPFVIISLVTHVFFFTDQILILRTLDMIGYSTFDVEFIASAISTWSPKICTIITAIGSGMAISLIPTIVSSYTKKNKIELEENINKALSLVISLSLPVTLGLSILSNSVWRLFYNNNIYGGMILKYAVYSAMLANIYLVITNILQSLNRFKYVYLVSFVGFLLNALLDVPLMYLFHYLGIEAFLGSILASVIGYSTSIIIGLTILKKKDHISYKVTASVIMRNLIPGGIMFISLLLLNNILPFNEYTLSGAIITSIIDVIVGGVIYLYFAYRTRLIQDVLGKDVVNKVLKKLTRGKLKIN